MKKSKEMVFQKEKTSRNETKKGRNRVDSWEEASGSYEDDTRCLLQTQ